MHFEFVGRSRYAVFDVEIVRRGDEITVVVTETPDNPGRSVTNCWPDLADAIYWELLVAPHGHRLPDAVTWVEHYLPHGRFIESWDEVSLEWEKLGYRVVRDRHPWRRLADAEVAQLLAHMAAAHVNA